MPGSLNRLPACRRLKSTRYDSITGILICGEGQDSGHPPSVQQREHDGQFLFLSAVPPFNEYLGDA